MNTIGKKNLLVKTMKMHYNFFLTHVSNKFSLYDQQLISSWLCLRKQIEYIFKFSQNKQFGVCINHTYLFLMKHFDIDELQCVKTLLQRIPAIANSAFLYVIIFDMHLYDSNGKMKSYLIFKIDLRLFLENNFLSYIDCPRSV